MKKAGEILECDLHLGCFAHVLNLAAQRGLKVKPVSAMLARIRRIVAFFHRSSTAASLLKVHASNLDLPNHKLKIDVATRWNSAFDMLERYIEMQVAVDATLMSPDLKNKDKDLKFLQDDDIRVATMVMESLKPLKQVTTMLCSEKNPTVSTIIPLYNKMLNVYFHAQADELPAVTSLKSAIAEDLKGRYDSCLKILLKATALDPRFKGLPHLTDQERFGVYNELTTDIMKESKTVPVKHEPCTSDVASGSATAINLEENPALPELPALQSLSEETDAPSPKKLKLENCQNSNVISDLLGDVFVTKVENAVSPLKQAEIEIQRYKEIPAVPLTADPLIWWMDNQEKFPLLSCTVKRFLCIPSTSVPSERVFSTAGDIVSSQRASLKATRVDQLIFLKKKMGQ